MDEEDWTDKWIIDDSSGGPPLFSPLRAGREDAKTKRGIKVQLWRMKKKLT